MRKKYVDFAREIALFYMFFQHGVLTVLKQSENAGVIFFLNEIVPFCSALFLFLAGYSIVLSLKKNGVSSYNLHNFTHLIKRGVVLCAASSVLFFIENGFQTPDIFLTSGILNTIGIFIIISSVFLFIPHRRIFFTIFTISATIVYVYFDLKETYFVPFNYGYEPIFPTILFGFIGITFGLFADRIEEKSKLEKAFYLCAALVGVVIHLAFSFKHGFLKVFFTEFGRYTVERIFSEKYLFSSLFYGGREYSDFQALIWNFRTNSFFAALGSTFFLIGSLYFMEPFFKKYLPKKIFIPGKYAFINYFYHLAILAILTQTSGFNSLGKYQFLTLLVSLFIGSYIISYIAEFITKPKKTI
ncbi:MAG TPA: heparan-alpha-glucosaminide N-acetyltransferase domain-containing protein [Spirochaetota bacterium]|nr:heparan-alpha-glucosaminide N-acetyltransferase domain-containing protein [Spirochaetota bacterium]HOS32241.1 heparan-alpha-glucosaminide N-acetyltransferase domain-containing protein [Spirochaetota bacterium]HOS55109.1 heparan-alpha-glucosaminide N-acetyltransferase domain-containing protein [Spirochaetota bacterium]HPK62135.1 heparan-alpha-glucosaminide N-acetyltransferase domain-containing protein [Spirochaetota bacterium]HQF77616.1 heparan-alpha-glucosaminide N-acetyltransferase domain-c